MSTLKNKVVLIGLAGMQPEIKLIGEKNKVAKLSMATKESRKTQEGEWIDETQWHNVVAWGSTAEFMERNIQKGQSFMVQGKLVYRSYDAKDGSKRQITEIVADQVELVGKKLSANIEKTK